MKKELSKRIISSLILLPISLFIIIEGSILFNFFIFICLIITCYEWNMMTKKKIINILGLIFLIYSFYSIYNLRNNFTEGYTYKDYKSGDKIAAAGIGALVATSLGVKALKSGGGAAAAGGILLLLKKFWWILLAPLAFLGKLFGGGDNEQSNNTSKPKSRAKKKDD